MKTRFGLVALGLASAAGFFLVIGSKPRGEAREPAVAQMPVRPAATPGSKVDAELPTAMRESADKLIDPKNSVASPQRQTSPAMNYGQFIDFALSDGTAAEAKRASDVLAVCGNEERLRTGLDSLKGKGLVSNERLNSLINESEMTLRQCQTIDGDSYRKEGVLLEKALRGKAPGAAVRYGDSVKYQPSMDMLFPLLDGLRADSAAGDSAAMTRLVLHGRDLKLDAVEIQAYYLLAMKVGEQNQNQLLNATLKNRNSAELTPQQMIAAQALAEKLHAQMPKR